MHSYLCSYTVPCTWNRTSCSCLCSLICYVFNKISLISLQVKLISFLTSQGILDCLYTKLVTFCHIWSSTIYNKSYTPIDQRLIRRSCQEFHNHVLLLNTPPIHNPKKNSTLDNQEICLIYLWFYLCCMLPCFSFLTIIWQREVAL